MELTGCNGITSIIISSLRFLQIMKYAASLIVLLTAMIALPLAAEALVWKWLPRESPEDLHPDLRTHAERWYDYMRQGWIKIQLSLSSPLPCVTSCNLHSGASAQSCGFVLFSFGTSGYQLGCTIAVVSSR